MRTIDINGIFHYAGPEGVSHFRAGKPTISEFNFWQDLIEAKRRLERLKKAVSHMEAIASALLENPEGEDILEAASIDFD